MEILTTSPNQTKKLGQLLAKEILKTNLRKTAFIIGLEGDLGGGKTTFLKGFAKGLGIKEKILSPTFVIMRKFEIRENLCSNSCKFASFYHIDCFRIEKPKEILDLGFKKLVQDPKNILAIEWAERIKRIIPKNAIRVSFEFMDAKRRKITIKL